MIEHDSWQAKKILEELQALERLDTDVLRGPALSFR